MTTARADDVQLLQRELDAVKAKVRSVQQHAGPRRSPHIMHSRL